MSDAACPTVIQVAFKLFFCFQRFKKNTVGDYVLAIDWELVDVNYFDAGFDPLTAHTDDNVRVYSLSSDEDPIPSGKV